MEEDAVFIKKVRQAILYDLNNPNLNSTLIAQKLEISRMQLHRKLKSLVRQSTTEYINFIRIEYAKKQLTSTTKFTYEIAKECGFSHYTYFSKIFKKYTNCSPTAFRKKYVE